MITTVIKIFISTTLFFVWVVRYENIITEFRRDYNYPDWLRDVTGITKLSFAAMLVSANPELNNLGLKGIIFLMCFAMLTHIRVKSGFRKVLPSIVLLSLCLTLLFLA